MTMTTQRSEFRYKDGKTVCVEMGDVVVSGIPIDPESGEDCEYLGPEKIEVTLPLDSAKIMRLVYAGLELLNLKNVEMSFNQDYSEIYLRCRKQSFILDAEGVQELIR